MAVSDGEIVFGVIGYFTILTVLLSTFSIGGPSVFLPGPVQANESIGEKIDTTATVGTGLLCAGAIGLTFLSLGVFWGAIIVSCGAFGFALVSQFAVPDDTISPFQYIFAFVYMLFQVLAFQLPVHPIINTIIVLPGAAPLVYLGVRLFRGGG